MELEPPIRDAENAGFHRAEPEYEELEGWPEELGGAATVEDLPAAARKYVERIAELGGVPIRHCSVGPDRDQTLAVDAA